MKKRKNHNELPITEYDENDTTAFINTKKRMTIADIGFAIPTEKVSQVVSIRLPRRLINALKSLGTQKDVPYHSLIKIFLWDRVESELGSNKSN